MEGRAVSRQSPPNLSPHARALASMRRSIGTQPIPTSIPMRFQPRSISRASTSFLIWPATMEPMNVTVKLEGDRCEIWSPTQYSAGPQQTAAKVLGIDKNNVTVHVTFMGAERFGRRFGVPLRPSGAADRAPYPAASTARVDSGRRPSHTIALPPGLHASDARQESIRSERRVLD